MGRRYQCGGVNWSRLQTAADGEAAEDRRLPLAIEILGAVVARHGKFPATLHHGHAVAALCDHTLLVDVVALAEGVAVQVDQAKLIKVFVNTSKCLTLVDRGVGMAVGQAERALASEDELRGR